MYNVILTVIFLLAIQNFAHSQSNEKSNISQEFKKENSNLPENYKVLISIGFGNSWKINYNSEFVFSLDIIPKLSKKIFLDFKVDLIKQGQSYNTFINIIPEYKIDFSKSSKFSGYFGIVPTIFFYPKGGHSGGLDASITPQVKIEYSLKTFFMNAEIRKPIYFYEDSGHIDLLLSLNFGIKL